MTSFDRKDIDWENCPQRLITESDKPDNIFVTDTSDAADFWSSLDTVFSDGKTNIVVWRGAPKINENIARKILSGPVRNCNSSVFKLGVHVKAGSGKTSLEEFRSSLRRSFLIPDHHISEGDVPGYKDMVGKICGIFNSLNETWPLNDHRALLQTNAGLAKTTHVAKFRPHSDGAEHSGHNIVNVELNMCWTLAGAQTVLFDNSDFDVPDQVGNIESFSTKKPTLWHAEPGAAVILPVFNTFSRPAVHATPFHKGYEKPQKRIFIRSRVVLEPDN